MKNFLISAGLYVAIGLIMGTVSVLIMPKILWWQTALLIGGTIALTSIGNLIEKKLVEKGKNKEKA
ncbi:MAG: hypothetical protein FWC97_06245 [Treponema sp.]|nr:hypothetical protein [Treponema sp.]